MRTAGNNHIYHHIQLSASLGWLSVNLPGGPPMPIPRNDKNTPDSWWEVVLAPGPPWELAPPEALFHANYVDLQRNLRAEKIGDLKPFGLGVPTRPLQGACALCLWTDRSTITVRSGRLVKVVEQASWFAIVPLVADTVVAFRKVVPSLWGHTVVAPGWRKLGLVVDLSIRGHSSFEDLIVDSDNMEEIVPIENQAIQACPLQVRLSLARPLSRPAVVHSPHRVRHTAAPRVLSAGRLSTCT
jgi:hypothetical protein